MLAVGSMILVRQLVQDRLIGPLAGLDQAPVRVQWDVLILFVVFFTAAIGTIAWMVRRYVKEGRVPDELAAMRAREADRLPAD